MNSLVALPDTDRGDEDEVKILNTWLTIEGHIFNNIETQNPNIVPVGDDGQDDRVEGHVLEDVGRVVRPRKG